jgi:hypothetical protein
VNALLVAFRRVRVLRGFAAAGCAAAVSVICAFSAGCADAATTASQSFAIHAAEKSHAVAEKSHAAAEKSHAAAEKSTSRRFCAYEISTPTAAEVRVIGHYWTPLARSALQVVSRGKMTVTVPKEHLTWAQRRALRLAQWAESAFSPKPKLVCIQLPFPWHARPRGGGPPGAAARRPGSAGQGKGSPAGARRGRQPIGEAAVGKVLIFTLESIDLSRNVIIGDEHLDTVW